MMSLVIISLRQGNRSTQAPAGSPMISQGRQADAVIAATATVLACRTVTASSGIPTTAMASPPLLIVWPIHSSRKLRCRSRPAARRTARVPGPVPATVPGAGG
jgi:hypothetical protein